MSLGIVLFAFARVLFEGKERFRILTVISLFTVLNLVKIFFIRP